MTTKSSLAWTSPQRRAAPGCQPGVDGPPERKKRGAAVNPSSAVDGKGRRAARAQIESAAGSIAGEAAEVAVT
eukprot:302552-Pleurochrysis_carterae.AAC.1